jgi:hypothetical protein
MPYALCPMPYALYQACTALLLRKAIYRILRSIRMQPAINN